MTNSWTIVNFQEGPLLRVLGPLYLAQEYPGTMLSDYGNAWSRFLALMQEPDDEKSRRRWRHKGYRRVKVEVTVEFADQCVERVND